MKPKSTLLSFLAIAGSSLLAISYTHGASIYWDGTSTSWNTAANWSTASGASTPDPLVVPGILDDLIFNITTANGAESITLDASQNAKSLTFNNTGTTTLLGGGTARTLTLGTGGITMGASAGAVTLGDGLAVNDVLISLASGAQTWTNNSASNNFTINNSSATFTRALRATLTFNQASTGLFSINTTSLPNSNDIVGPWAFFNNGSGLTYARNNSGTIVGLGYTGGTDGTSATDANDFTSSTSNYTFSTTGTTVLTPSTTRTANTIRYTGTGGIIDLSTTAVAQNLTLNGILATGASGTLTIQRTAGTGTVVIGATNELVIAGSQAVTISSPISGATKTLTYSGSNTLILSGANTYTGSTVVNSGTMQAGIATSAFGNNTAVTVNSGATLALSTFSNTIGSLSGSGSVTMSAASAVGLTIKGTGINSTFSGNISGGLTGQNLAGFTMDAAATGTLTLTGTNNTIKGWTQLNGGTLSLGGVDSMPGITSAGGLNFNGGTLQFSSGNQVDYSGRLNNNAGPVRLDVNGQTVNWVVGSKGSGSLTISSSSAGGIFNITGADAHTGATTVNSGTLNLSGSGALSGGTAITTNGTGIFTQTGTGVISGASTFTQSSSGTSILSKANTFTGATTVTNGILSLSNSSALQNSAFNTTGSTTGTSAIGLKITTTTLTLGGLSGNKDFNTIFETNSDGGPGGTTATGGYAGITALTLNPQSGSVTYTASIGDATTGMTLTKTGAGTQVLSGTNGYTGTTTGTAGILLASTTASLPGYNVAGKVIFNGGTIGGPVGGAGWTTDQVDTLLSNATKTSGTLGIDTTNASLTQWTGFNTSNFGGIGITKLGTNTLTLDQANTYTGTTAVNAGTLRLTNTSALASSSALTMATGTTLDLRSNTAATFNTPTIALPGGSANSVTINVDNISSGTGNLLTLSSGLTLLNNTAGAVVTLNTTGGNGYSLSIPSLSITTSGGNNSATATTLNPSVNTTIGTLTSTANTTDLKLNLGGAAGTVNTINTLTTVKPSVYNPTGNKDTAATWIVNNWTQVGGPFTMSAGTLTITGTLNVSGMAGGTRVFNVTGGTLNLNSTTALTNSASNFQIGGASLDNTFGSAIILSTNPNMTLTGNLTFVGTNGANSDLNLGTGTVVMSNSRQVTVTNSATTLTVGGVVSGVGFSLTKAGAGTLKLGGANTYSGGTIVSAGTLIMTSPSNLSNGALNVGGNNFIYAPTTAGVLNIGSGVLTLTNGSKIGTALGGTVSQSAITSTGVASLTGTGTIDIYGIPGVTTTAGTHNLITATSGLDAGTYSLGKVYNNTNFTVSNFTRVGGTAISVDVAAPAALTSIFWTGTTTAGLSKVWAVSDGSATSNWSASAGGFVQGLVPGTTAMVTIPNSTPTAGAEPTGTTLGADMSIAGLVIADTVNGLGLNYDGNRLTIGTGGITMNASVPGSSIAAPIALNGNQTWTNNSVNTLTVSGVVSGTGNLIKAGTGTVILSGRNTNTGTTIVSTGTLQLGAGGTTGALTGTSSITNDGNLTINRSNAFTQATDLNGKAITGSGSFTQAGGGTTTLSATNTYSGVTTVSAGTLYVTGALSNSTVTVQASGALGGRGTLANGLTIQTGGDLDLTGATLGLNSADVLSLTGGGLTLGNLTFQDLVGWDWANASAGTYELIDGSFSINWGSTAYLSEGTAYDFGNGKSGYFTTGSLTAVIVAIPEPRAALLGGLGILMLLRRRRRA